MRRFLLSLPFFCAACGDNSGPHSVPATCGIGLEPYVSEPSVFKTVKIWMQDDPDLSKIKSKEGCELWLPKGIQCEVSTSELGSAVRIYASHKACIKDPVHGGYVLATAESSGRIMVQLECLRDWFVPEEEGGVSQQVLKLVLGHEIGHEAGLWYHVPATCDYSAATSAFERELVQMNICGQALMNPVMDTNVCFMTDLDARAYDLRDPNSSKFPRATEMPDGCVLTYTPPAP